MDAALGSLALFNAGMSALPNAAVPAVANPADVQRFEQAMSSGSTAGAAGVEPVPDASAPVETGDLEVVRPPVSMGDAILHTVDRLSKDWQAGVDKINAHMKGEPDKPMSFQGMVQLQLDLTMLSMQSDMTGRVADRISQGLQTLFRNQ